ncbi:hypothetical protein FIBSPDRAFT_212487 [Athelia psychrophila]|uniref:Uncharacterized protein n=1 Tax=Athelia psychrophila TaxID=1759441 RepID=A0A166SAB7_9AGAM|nr:hypothetical protein FIBSPDRAFT_212487 [Fibularhizoctonia sp. CBS 109695]
MHCHPRPILVSSCDVLMMSSSRGPHFRSYLSPSGYDLPTDDLRRPVLTVTPSPENVYKALPALVVRITDRRCAGPRIPDAALWLALSMHVAGVELYIMFTPASTNAY